MNRSGAVVAILGALAVGAFVGMCVRVSEQALERRSAGHASGSVHPPPSTSTRHRLADARQPPARPEFRRKAGYAILADCIDPDRSRDETTPVRAREYYERERASTLRRSIRRACLEAAPPRHGAIESPPRPPSSEDADGPGRPDVSGSVEPRCRP